MPVLQLNDQQFPLEAGTTRVGSGGEADVPLPADPGLGIQAIIDRSGQGPMTIRRAAPSASVRVNGVLLGAEPTPLMHGDKVEIGGLELRFADDAKGGATQFVSASDIAALAGTKRAGAARPTAASGGRVVSLVDGKEYSVPSRGLVFGREAACDVVVAQNEVSRRHAEITPGDEGYVLRDISANGVFVNGERVKGSQRLVRSDVVRIGKEEFRFYADLLATGHASAAPASAAPASAAPATAPASGAPGSAPPSAVRADAPPAAPRQPEVAASVAAPAAPAPAAPAPAPAAPRLTEGERMAMMSAPTPLAQPAYEDPRPVLARLETLNAGPTKGAAFVLRTPLAHVGRGAHNDVRLADESVSETHAKLQRREDGWYVVDMESTNGTYVAGTRIKGERRLDGSPDIRFGGIKMRFTSMEAANAPAPAAEPKGTRPIASVERPKRAAAAAERSEPAPASGGRSALLWLILLVVIAVVGFFVLQGRA